MSSAQIVFPKDEQSKLPEKLQTLVQAYEQWQFDQQSLNEVGQNPLSADTLGSKEEVQYALKISLNTLSKALNHCSEQDISRVDIDSTIKEKLVQLKRERELTITPRHQAIERER